MEATAKFLADLAGKSRTGGTLYVPLDKKKELAEELVKGLREKLNIEGTEPSPYGDWPHRVTGDLRNDVAYKIINGNIEFGYKMSDKGVLYGEILQNDPKYGRKGPTTFLLEDGKKLIDEVFGVGGYTISHDPYGAVDV